VTDFDDDNENGDDEPKRDLRRLGWGIFAAAFLVYVSHDVFQSGESTYGRGRYLLKDDGAKALGYMTVFMAGFFHFHYFWAFFPNFALLRRVCTWISVIGAGISFLVVCIYISQHPESRVK
jgi:hypothetical protein